MRQGRDGRAHTHTHMATAAQRHGSSQQVSWISGAGRLGRRSVYIPAARRAAAARPYKEAQFARLLRIPNTRGKGSCWQLTPVFLAPSRVGTGIYRSIHTVPPRCCDVVQRPGSWKVLCVPGGGGWFPSSGDCLVKVSGVLSAGAERGWMEAGERFELLGLMGGEFWDW